MEFRRQEWMWNEWQGTDDTYEQGPHGPMDGQRGRYMDQTLFVLSSMDTYQEWVSEWVGGKSWWSSPLVLVLGIGEEWRRRLFPTTTRPGILGWIFFTIDVCAQGFPPSSGHGRGRGARLDNRILEWLISRVTTFLIIITFFFFFFFFLCLNSIRFLSCRWRLRKLHPENADRWTTYFWDWKTFRGILSRLPQDLL